MARWTPIAAGLFCPAVVSPRSGCTALFARSATGELFYQERAGLQWGPSQSLGVPVAHAKGSELAVPVGWQLAVCRGTDGRLELFATSPDGELLEMHGTSGGWGSFECLGSPAQIEGSVPAGLTSPPAVCSNGVDRLDVFVRGLDGELLQTTRNGAGWGGFESLGFPTITKRGVEVAIPLIEPVTACRCGDAGTAIFLRGMDGDLLMKWGDDGGWTDYASLGQPDVADASYPAVRVPASLMGPPAACSWGPGRIDVFVRGPHGDILQRTWNGKEWSGFESLGMAAIDDEAIPFTGAVTACASDVGALDVVTRAVDGRLYHAHWDGAWDRDLPA